ncbi:MAG TPA: methionyl-tRNA formyltransferase [Candidatus Mediterraneibacter merdipullorum]|nr:methionyl-tRNA formyltransferase [Candidatus Mediterraneibacter merdipullorum]
MRVIFMGTPDFSVGTLEALIAAGHDVCLAVTQPDKPKGRGGKMQYPPVKEKALFHGIPVYQPRRVRESECVEELRRYHADVIVVVAFGQILPKSILEMTPYGCINVHASLLPKYRGAAPIQWAIIEGEEVTGVTTMQMDEGLDTGDMLLKTEVPIAPDETGETLHDKLASAGAALCVETLKALEEGSVTGEKQGESPTAYARMLTKELGNIDWTQSAVQIERLVRGLNSWPSAYTRWNGNVLKIWQAKALPDIYSASEAGAASKAGAGATQTGGPKAGAESAEPGTVRTVEKDSFTVQTGDGLLQVLEVQMPGKKRMETGAFLRGNPMKAGALLTRE